MSPKNDIIRRSERPLDLKINSGRPFSIKKKHVKRNKTIIIHLCRVNVSIAFLTIFNKIAHACERNTIEID